MGTLPDLKLTKYYIVFVQSDAANKWDVIPKSSQCKTLLDIPDLIKEWSGKSIVTLELYDLNAHLYEMVLSDDKKRLVYVHQAEVPISNGIKAETNGLHDNLERHVPERYGPDFINSAPETDAQVATLDKYSTSKSELFVYQTSTAGEWIVFDPEEQDAVAGAINREFRVDFGPFFPNNNIADNSGVVWDPNRTWCIENWCSLADVFIAYRGVRSPVFAIFRIRCKIPNHSGAITSSAPTLKSY